MSTLEASVEAKLLLSGARDSQWRFTIFRVPAYVRESRRTSYEPRMVSIGPYYHGDPALRAMEDHKWRCLGSMLFRCAGEVTASELLAVVRPLEAQVRACYSESPVGMGSDEFVQMLLLDGCFILDFLVKWHRKETDELCDVGWGLTLVVTDLLLMENQIPFFVLERLWDTVNGMPNPRELLLKGLVDCFDEKEPIMEPSGDWVVNHLLHLYYECYVPKRPGNQPTAMISQASQNVEVEMGKLFYDDCRCMPKRTPATTKTIPRATELLESGVTFKLNKASRNKFDVTFNRWRGVMRIPAIEIDDMKRPLFVNLMAFEMTVCGEQPRLLSSYVTLMSNLIVTARDVELLRRRGILKSMLADDEEAARFFSRLGEGAAVNYKLQAFAGLFEDLRRYCAQCWHKHRATLRRDYCTSPWTALSVAAAAVILFLTATQTYFTVFPPKN